MSTDTQDLSKGCSGFLGGRWVGVGVGVGWGGGVGKYGCCLVLGMEP